ncbi:hypothetical protein B0H14DRAFT_3857515, partial [Mycena olivaceomarginata]
MSRHPLRALGDSAELDYATFGFDHRVLRYFFLAGFIVLIYDHLLTLGTEVKFIWSSKLRASTCWFLAVRYIAFSANIAVAVYNFGNLDYESTDIPDSCVKMLWVRNVLLLSQETLIEVTLSIYVFAMYGLNRLVLACLLSAICVIASLGLWASVTYGQHTEIPDVPGMVGCHIINRDATALRMTGTRVAILVCDILVFALTFRRACIQGTSPLHQRLAKDGSMYFGIIVLANLANVLTFYLGDGLIP